MQFIKQYWYFLVVVGLIIGWIMVDNNMDKGENYFVIDESNSSTTPSVEEEEAVAPTSVMVDIKGAVKKPGVYELPIEDRVQNAIQRAGGLQEDADIEQINLAERVYDEMVIYIPFIHEQLEPLSEISGGNPHGKIRVNLATAEELTTLPGIGESKAEAIIEFREKNGKFTKLEDLTQVSGIGEKTVERLAEFILVP